MSRINDNIKSLSEKEVRIIAGLEFNKNYYFTRDNIRHHFDSDSKLNYTIHRLISKKRIIKLNRNKYYLIPIKAKTGKWTDRPFIIVDEMFNGKDYYIGGWASANYWRLTDQVPMKIEVFTNKRNGTKKILTSTFIFKKTTQKRIDNSVTKKIDEHDFKILGKKEVEEWMKLRN
jgi:predicted transcriptional regulator of viral defense system